MMSEGWAIVPLEEFLRTLPPDPSPVRKGWTMDDFARIEAETPTPKLSIRGIYEIANKVPVEDEGEVGGEA
jgi:hypothetical protein